MKKIILGIIVFAILGGGGYWYLFMYQPAQFGKGVTGIFQKMQSANDLLGPGNLKGNQDFDGALKILRERQEFFEARRNELMELTVPWLDKEMQEVRDGFSALFESFLSANSDAKDKILFIAGAAELYDVLKPIRSPAKEPQTAGDAAVFFESVMPRAKAVAKNTFENEIQGAPPKLSGDSSFEELKSLWNDTSRGIDAAAAYAKTLNPVTPIQKLEEDFQNKRVPVDAFLIEKMDEFFRKLESAVLQNNLSDIIMYRTFPGGVPGEEINKRFPGVEAKLKEILEKYGKERNL